MLCKNCNYILTGKENFCPNCAAPLKDKTSEAKECEENKEEKNIRQDKYGTEIISKKLIFPEGESKKTTEKKPVSFFMEEDDMKSKEAEIRPRSYAGKIMFLLFLTCVFIVGAFTVADYFGITASVVNLINSDADETTQALYNHESSIINPDFNYVPETAYVMSGKGLPLRKGPGKNYASVAELEELTAVTVYGGSFAQEEWVYVYCNEKGSYGWLDGSFLAKDENEEITTVVENVSQTGVIIEDIDSQQYPAAE